LEEAEDASVDGLANQTELQQVWEGAEDLVNCCTFDCDVLGLVLVPTRRILRMDGLLIIICAERNWPLQVFI